jgi:HEPN domain-containing protein
MKVRTRKEDRSAAIDYFNKAEDNHKAMLSAFAAKHHNAAGTLALQCAVSSADALCVYFKGLRSVSQDDLDICELVGSIPLPEAAAQAALLRRVIGKKNLVQYERRNVTAKEAEELAKAASEFYRWACSLARPVGRG